MPRLVAFALAVALAAPSVVQAQNPPATVSVDVAANRRPINPLIYGVHFGDTATLQDLKATINRYGGNSTGRYNWVDNIDNRGVDYYFESIPYPDATPGELGDTFIATTKAAGAEPFLTMPMVGWVAKTNANRDILYSFSVASYGPQTDVDVNLPDAGNGCAVGPDVFPCFTGTPITPPTSNPNDASMPADGAFQQGWMQHVRNTWGPASAGGLRYWGLDNEPSIWHAAYWDVHPQGADMDEMRTKMIDYGGRIKTVDSTAQVLAPEEWGWDGYFYSGKDQQLIAQGVCGGPDCPDRLAHGGQDYVPYLLTQMRQHEIATGQRVLDMLTLHFYPQGGEFEFSNDVSPAMQQLRNRSTRGLWDPNYLNESYINDYVMLIRRMRSWVNTYYPGLPIGLTEYNWGAESHINGATSQADVLGILGREGADMGIRWVVPAAGTHVYNAFKMFRNYDGAGSGFGDTSVSAGGPNPDNLAVFAAQRTATGAVTVMAISKVLSGNTPTTISLASFTPGPTAEVWQMTAANIISHLPDVPVSANSIQATLPAQSITLFVIPAASMPSLSIAAVSVPEGNTGATDAVFTVSLSTPSTQTVKVAYATADDTATAGADYVSQSGSLTFTPGTTARTVTVGVFGDRVFEGDETFFVNLSNPTNATISAGQGVGTIQDDDPQGLSIDDVTVVEGRTGPVGAAFTVTLSPVDPFQPVTVDYATADGTATEPDDYLAAGGTLTFLPGTATQAVNVTVNADALVEGAEAFVVDLSNAGGAAIAYAQGTATILDPWPGGDFDGDGKPDILFRHAISGKNVVWLMDGVTRTAGVFTNPAELVDTNWQMVGTADFSADGKTDILWRHAVSGKNVVWYMDGVNRTGGVFTNPSALPDTNWKMVGTGDFDSSGQPDILFRHAVSGRNVLWFMDGITRTSGVFTNPDALQDTNWQMVGVGQFSGDGKPDILWRHAVSGKNVLWFMDGAARRSGVFTNPDQLPDTNWRMVAVGDYSGDEKPDILFRHAISGKNVVWFMDGANRLSGTFTNPAQLPDTNWKIVGPR